LYIDILTNVNFVLFYVYVINRLKNDEFNCVNKFRTGDAALSVIDRVHCESLVLLVRHKRSRSGRAREKSVRVARV
jgi:hypothetical protein